MPHRHYETHRIHRAGWLRAAVLGANDGIVSTASLIVGVAAAGGDSEAVWIAGAAGLVAGAMSMAAGEYVSVSSQSDAERADIEVERKELRDNPAHELDELTGIYVRRGLDRSLARQVAEQLTAHDALGAHTRDELGIIEQHAARPVQAAFASATSFAVGAALPLAAALLSTYASLIWVTTSTSMVFLLLLGAVSARSVAAPVLPAAWRVGFWGALAMALTAGVGHLFGITMG